MSLFPAAIIPTKKHEAGLRRQIKWLLLVRVTLLSLLLGISSLLQYAYPNHRLPSLGVILSFILFVHVFSVSSALFINTLRRHTLFAYGQVIADSVFVAIIVYFSGGSQSMFTFIYFFPIISSGLLLLRTGALIIATFNACSYGLVLSAELIVLAIKLPSPVLHNQVSSPNVLMQNFSILGLSFYLVAMLSSTLAQRLRLTEDALSRTSLDLDRLSQLYKQIFDDISSGIITVDAKGAITSFNQAAEQITGYLAMEVIGKPVDNLFPGFKLPAASGDRPVINISSKDGRKISVGYSWAKLNMPDGCEDCRVYTLQDLSKIKQMEKMIKQSEKMAAIGEIAAGIAHEFRNPLAAISGAAQVLNQEESISTTSKALSNIIIRECSRMEDNIGDFLQFSKPVGPEKVWLSLQNKIQDSWDIIRQGGKTHNNCALKTDIPANLDCWADAYQLKQIFINLIHNACLAMDGNGKGGAVFISACEQQDSHGRMVISIQIRDTGRGIEPSVMKHIFEPFFTTRENGTGLGLAIVKQIVEGHNGSIKAKSTPQKGAVFTIKLPLP